MFVKAIAVVDFLQVKLELVVGGDGDIRMDKGTPIIIEALLECHEVLVGIPFCVVFLL
jgi:hypothetical protein